MDTPKNIITCSSDTLTIFKLDKEKYIEFDTKLYQIFSFDQVLIIIEKLKELFGIPKRYYSLLKYFEKRFYISETKTEGKNILISPLSDYTESDIDDTTKHELRRLIAFYELIGIRKIDEKNIYLKPNESGGLDSFVIKETSTINFNKPEKSFICKSLLQKWMKDTHILYYIKLLFQDCKSISNIKDEIDNVISDYNLDQQNCTLFRNYFMDRFYLYCSQDSSLLF